MYLFVTIDRVSKFAFAELHSQATRRLAADFLRRLIERCRKKIHPIRHRASLHEIQSPMDQRPSRTDEPHSQGRDGAALQLPNP